MDGNNDQQAVRLTVVMPVRDREAIVERTLQSVAAQTLRPLRLVVVDNGSTDGTVAAVERWLGAGGARGVEVTLVREPRPGASAARNAGLALVRTEWTMFFDSDDTMAPDHCSRALAAADACPEASVVGWDVNIHGLDGSIRRERFTTADAGYHNLFHAIFGTQRYMARTGLFRAAGGWDEAAPAWVDIELGARILARRPVMTVARGAVSVDMYQQERSITGTSFSRGVERFEATLRLMERDGVDRRWVDLKRAILAADCAREGSDHGPRILAEVLSAEKSAWRRLLLKSAYGYRLRGGRGIARLLRPLM